MKRNLRLHLLALLLAVIFALPSCISSGMPDFVGTDIKAPTTVAATSATVPGKTTAGTTSATTAATTSASTTAAATTKPAATTAPPVTGLHPEGIPEYSGQPFVVLNNNIPAFTPDQYTTTSYETYAPLDSLGRCGTAIACVGVDIMPTEPRGDIGSVKPTGWHSVQYSIVDGGSLYNRCHLIGFQLTGENANRQNLITGTRYMNWDGMVEFETMIADYVKETKNHVLYRVTPIFQGDNLIASGVQMEAWSVEDNGEGICFNVYAYNVQPGITIDYLTGESRLTDPDAGNTPDIGDDVTYIINKNNKKFHKHDCGNAATIKESNREYSSATRDELVAKGYIPAGCCNP